MSDTPSSSGLPDHSGTLRHPDGAEAAEMMRYQVSWGAIFAGTIIALVVQVLLSMLGAGFGIASLDIGTAETLAASTFSVLAGIWFLLTGLVAAYLGGYIAARLSGKTSATTGALHGLTTWALTTLFVLYLLTTTIGSLVSGAFSGLTSALGAVGQTVAQSTAPLIASSNPLDALESRIRATGNDPQALNNAAVNSVRALVTGDEAAAETARQRAAQALATARGIPLDQATQQVTEMEREYHAQVAAVREQATVAAEATASVVSTAALLAFVALALGAIAGWMGGRSGIINPIYADRLLPTRRSL